MDIAETFIQRLFDSGFHGIFINITNPCDLIAREIWKRSGYDQHKIFGTGTGLDTCRLKTILGNKFNVDPKSVNGYMLGEHGGSQMVAYSQISINGKPLSQLETEYPEKYQIKDKAAICQQVKDVAWVTYDGKGCTEFGIASTLARFVQVIFHKNKVASPLHLPNPSIFEGLNNFAEPDVI